MKGRQHGKWNPDGLFPLRCSCCGRGSIQPENFCPTCGADMRFTIQNDDDGQIEGQTDIFDFIGGADDNT